MPGKRIINFIAGLLFVGIFCLNSGAFGSLPYGDAGLSSEKVAGYAQVPSEVVFIDPSVPEMERIVAQLPQGAEVVRLSPGMDGVTQISAHLAGKVALSAIRIISHGNAGYFVLNGKRIDGDFLRNHGNRIAAWGRALAENGDILLYACNLSATDEGKVFIENFADLTGADVAASTDVTGGEAFNGNWNLEYSIGRIATTALAIDPDIGVKLPTTIWGGTANSNWDTASNWDNGVPVDNTYVVQINTSTYPPNMDVSTEFASFTINAGKTLNIIAGGAINTTGDVTNDGTIASTDVDIIITASTINAGNITSLGGLVDLNATTLVSVASGKTITTTAGVSSIETTSGAIDITTTSNGTVNIAGDLVTSGGLGSYTDDGWAGGAVNIDTSNGAITVNAITTYGGSSGSGTGGAAGAINITAAGGTLTVGTLTAIGGPTEIGPGGDGAAITLIGADVTTTGRLYSDGGQYVGFGGGNAGNITIDATDGSPLITIGGDITANCGGGEGCLSGNIWFKDALEISSGVALYTQGQSYTSASGTVIFDGTVDGTTANSLWVSTGRAAVTFNGTVGDGNEIATLTVTTSDNAAATNIANNITTTGAQTFNNAVKLTGNAILDSSDANIIFNSTVNADTNTNDRTLTLDSGTGGVTITGSAGTTQALDTLTITNAGTVSLAAVDTRGGGLIFTNAATGTITLNGNISTDEEATAGAVTIKGAVTLGADIAIDTDASTTDAAISFSDTIDGTYNFEVITSATVTFSGSIGSNTPLGTMKLTNGILDTGGNNITASGLTVSDGTFNSGSAAGAWDINGNLSITGGTLIATSGNFNFSGTTWNTSGGTFTPNGGTVILDGTGQSLSGGNTSFYKLTKNVTYADSLAFQSGSATTITNALNLSGTSGQLLSLRSITSGTQWEIDPQGTRAIAFLDVKDSNVSGTAINAVDTNSVDSGNNTNWIFEAPTAPTITSFSPTSGGTNTSVIITGTNFTGATAVLFGGSAAASFTVNSFTQITAIVAGGSTGTVSVTTPGGTATSSDNFTYGAVTAGTYYVDITGNDSNAGTAAAPWKTLHYAIDQINGGATGTSTLPYTLLMAAGTYSTDNGEADTGNTLSQSYVTIVGADDQTIGSNSTTTLIDGTNATSWAKAVKITGSNVTIKGVSITKFSDDGGGYGIEISGDTGNEVVNCKIFSNDTGIEITSSSAFKIRGCEIYENTTDGLNVTSSTDGEIYHNTIYRHQGTGDDGIAAFNCSPAIKRNKIYDNDTGIRVEATGGGTASPDIRNNVIYETTNYSMAYGILVRAGGFGGGVASPTIYHNSIDGGSGDGIAIEWVSTEYSTTLAPVIKYNIITRCEAVGIDANAGATCAPNYNDVWGNGSHYSNECTAGANEMHQDPGNGVAGPLTENSPCIDAIPTNVGDDAIMDYLGYKRPKGSGYDMGAYEYIATQTYSYTLPGGAGIETDYRIFTVPLDIGTGLDMRNTMEGTLGSYDPTHWRVFARTTSGDIEMNTQAFASLDIKPGMGFWIITVYTSTINFQGTLSPDAIYYKMKLEPGWHLFAVPWPSTSINLGKIYVTDGVNEFAITNASNTLTEKYIWDYTGTGSTGYTVRNTSDFPLVAGTGYFIKVLGSSNIILSIPPNNTSNPPSNNTEFFPPAMSYGFPEAAGLPNDPEPPPLPGGSYGPMPNIRANGKSGLVTVPNGNPVSITVSLDPGDQVDKNVDWWIVAHTPFAWPLDWYSYVYPEGWRYGIYPCVQTPLFQVPQSFEVLNTILPTGDYKFYFAVDENADGIVDETWVDSVEVRVE